MGWCGPQAIRPRTRPQTETTPFGRRLSFYFSGRVCWAAPLTGSRQLGGEKGTALLSRRAVFSKEEQRDAALPKTASVTRSQPSVQKPTWTGNIERGAAGRM